MFVVGKSQIKTVTAPTFSDHSRRSAGNAVLRSGASCKLPLPPVRKSEILLVVCSGSSGFIVADIYNDLVFSKRAGVWFPVILFIFSI